MAISIICFDPPSNLRNNKYTISNRFFFEAAIIGQAVGAGANPLATLVNTGSYEIFDNCKEKESRVRRSVEATSIASIVMAYTFILSLDIL